MLVLIDWTGAEDGIRMRKLNHFRMQINGPVLLKIEERHSLPVHARQFLKCSICRWG